MIATPIRILKVIGSMAVVPQQACEQAAECSPWRGPAEPGEPFGKTNRACEAGDRIIPINCAGILMTSEQTHFIFSRETPSLPRVQVSSHRIVRLTRRAWHRSLRLSLDRLKARPLWPRRT